LNVVDIPLHRDQDASRLGSLINSKDWDSREQRHPELKLSAGDSERFLLEQIYEDLAALHGQTPEWYESETLDYYAFDWSHNGYTMGAYVYPGPGHFSALYPSIVKPAARGRFHIGGEAASKRQTWVAGALDSAWRCVYEILVQERSPKLADFLERYGENENTKFEMRIQDTSDSVSKVKGYWQGIRELISTYW
jgi:hypothetical protein